LSIECMEKFKWWICVRCAPCPYPEGQARCNTYEINRKLRNEYIRCLDRWGLKQLEIHDNYNDLSKQQISKIVGASD
jgi:hypothetical protein